MFKKFSSLENTYRQKEIDQIVNQGFADQPYIVTEKVHGANFSFILTEESITTDNVGEVSTINIRCAKRTGLIEDGEKFFNYLPVLEKYRKGLEELFKYCQDTRNAKVVTVFGELFGGNIQKGMCYPLEQDFVAFDLVVDDVARNKTIAFYLLNNFSIPIVPVIGIYDSLQEALKVNESFTSKLIREGFDGADKHKEAEGVVIEPETATHTKDGGRIYLKKKTKRFLESGGNKIPKPQPELSQEVMSALTTACSYITEPRFEAVCSKIGEVTITDIGKVTGLTTKDVIDDMVKDEVFIPESKQFHKLLQKEVMTFVRPLLLLKD